MASRMFPAQENTAQAKLARLVFDWLVTMGN
jgi:hypothetical protein